MLVSGVQGSLGLLGFLLSFLSQFISAPFDMALYIFMMILSFFASLGGGSVIIGGLLLGRGRLTTGKLLIRLGCGTGLLGFLIQLISRAIKGLDFLLTFLAGLTGSMGGVGILLCLSSMLLARKPPKSAEKKKSPIHRRLRPS